MTRYGKTLPRFWPFAALALLNACAALEGRTVGQPCDRLFGCRDGVSYYLSQPRFVIERRTGAGEKKRSQIDIVVGSEPDIARRFEVGMSPGLFTTDQFSIELTPDARPMTLNSSRADETAQVVAGMVNLTVEALRAAAALGGSAAAPAGGVAPPTELQLPLDCAKLGRRESDFVAPYLISFTCGATVGEEPLVTVDDLEAHCRLASSKSQAGDLDVHKSTSDRLAQALLYGGVANAPPVTPGALKEACDVLFSGLYGSVGALTQMTQPPSRRPSGTGELAEQKVAADELTTAEHRVAYGYALLRSLEDQKKGPKSLEEIGQGLQDEVAAKLLAAANGGSEAELTASIANLQNLVRLVLKADEAVRHRGLAARRQKLLAFLQADIPRGSPGKRAEIYREIATQLNEVNTALANLVPSVATPAGLDLPLAAEVTSRIDERIHVDRLKQPLQRSAPYDLVMVDVRDLKAPTITLAKRDASDEKLRVTVAEARIRYGGASAVVIAAPAASGGLR